MCYNTPEDKMHKIISRDKHAGVDKGDRLKKKFIPLLTLIFVIAIIAGIFYFYKNYPDKIEELKAYNYLGAFLISLILNATVVLPVGTFLVIATLGATLPSPALIGVAAGAGAAIGEIAGYMAGYSGRAIVQKQRMYARLEGWVRRWGAITIFVWSIVPFAFDLVGIAAGVLRFPLWKFLIACWLGRTILYVFIAFAGAWGWEAVLRYLG